MTRNRAIAGTLALLCGAVALWVYAPVTGFSFVDYGDGSRLLPNAAVRTGFSWESGGAAFGSAWSSEWAPLSWISHMIDFSLYGSDAGGHHRTNLLLHALNAMLLFGALRAATGETLPAAGVGLLLAVHPLHVETVAWVSERKGLLSSAFGLASLWCYAAHVRSGSARARRLSLLCFAFGLMSKATLVVLPLLLLLLDRWPLRRAGQRGLAELVREKWPYFVLAAASASVTSWVALESGSAVGLGQLPPLPRIANALVASGLYLAKLVWPSDLAVFYPHPYLPGGSPWSGLQVGAAALGIGLLAFGASRAPHPAPRIGLAWAAICLLPVAGLVQLGGQAMADRYAYLPAVGIYVAVVWSVAALARRNAALRAAALGLGCVLLVLLGVGCRQQLEVWGSSERLYRHATRVDPDNFSMHFRLAHTLKGRGRIEEAIEHYRTAVRIHPGMGSAHYDLANTLTAEDQLDAALEHYRLAVVALPGFEPARDALGRLLIRRGDLREALDHYREEARRRPASVEVQVNRANLAWRTGDLPEAIVAYEAATALAPDDALWREQLEELRAELRAAESLP